MRGKCWIYKKAIFYKDNIPQYIVDYSNGTESFDGSVRSINNTLVYVWNLAGEQIVIPVNINRYQTESIIKQGIIPLNDGEIRWECIFGLFESYSKYYLKRLIPILIVIFIIIISKK